VPDPASPSSSREKLLDVAEQLFSDRGYAAIGVHAVATRAGLGKSSLFHHFPSKALLYAAVLVRVIERIELGVAPIFGGGGRATEQLEAMVGALVDALAEHPTSARLLLRSVFEDDDPAVVAACEACGVDRRIQALLGRVRDVVEAGVAAGEFRPVSVPDLLQTVVGATVFHFASGDFGEQLFQAPLFTAESISRRKREVQTLLQHGLAPSSRPQGESS